MHKVMHFTSSRDQYICDGAIVWCYDNRFEAVFSLSDEMNVRKTLEQERQLLARRFFVIHDERVDGHGVFASPSIGVPGMGPQLGRRTRIEGCARMTRWV